MNNTSENIEDVEGKTAGSVPAGFNKDEYGAKVRAMLAGMQI